MDGGFPVDNSTWSVVRPRCLERGGGGVEVGALDPGGEGAGGDREHRRLYAHGIALHTLRTRDSHGYDAGWLRGERSGRLYT